MSRKMRISCVHNFDYNRIIQAGPGNSVIRRMMPNDDRFAVGNLFWIGGKLFVLAEITKKMRCNKQRQMIMRPIMIKNFKKGKNYTVYELKGLGV